MLYDITDALSFSFLFPLSPSSIEWFHCYNHVPYLNLYMIMLVFVYMFIFESIFHIWEKTCNLCVSEPGLLHLKLYPPIASFYLQTTCYYSLWLSSLCIYSTFSWSIHQSWGTWVVSKAWLLWIVLQWTKPYEAIALVVACKATCIPLSDLTSSHSQPFLKPKEKTPYQAFMQALPLLRTLYHWKLPPHSGLRYAYYDLFFSIMEVM
jgi:hypothetical protein